MISTNRELKRGLGYSSSSRGELIVSGWWRRGGGRCPGS